MTLFLVSFLPNSGLGILIKLLLIAGTISFGFYAGPQQLFGGSPAVSREKTASPNRPVPPVATKEKVEKSEDGEIEAYFQRFLTVLLPLIRQTVVANSAVFLMANYFKDKFYIRAVDSDRENEDFLSEEKYFPLNVGLPGLILKDKQALIEARLPDNNSLLPYYAGHPEPPRSFMGVPITFNNFIAGVLCVDATAEENFSEDDLQILREFGEALSIQLTCSNKVFEYQSENWMTRLLYTFSKTILEINSREELWTLLDNILKSDFGAGRVVISQRLNAEKARVVFCSNFDDHWSVGDQFPVNEGILGWVLREGQSMLVENFAAKTNYIPRFHLKEKPTAEYQSFLAVPIFRNNTAQLVISIESPNPHQFTGDHKQILETLAYQASACLQRIEVIENLASGNLLDQQTRLGNDRALDLELTREIKRSREHGHTFSLQLLRFDAEELHQTPSLNQVMVNEFLGDCHLPADYSFRLDDRLFAILWPEKDCHSLKKHVESQILPLLDKRAWADGQVSHISVTAGLAQFELSGSSPGELIENARRALRLARTKGNGSVVIFSETEAESRK